MRNEGKLTIVGMCWYCVVLLVVVVVRMEGSSAFAVPGRTSSSGRQRMLTRVQEQKKYGRGADIFPPTNYDTPINLADSFPNGVLPPILSSAMMANNETTTTAAAEDDKDDTSTLASTNVTVTTTGRKRRILKRILRGAAGAQQQPQDITKAPILVALGCLILVRPLDIASILLLSTYFIALGILSQSPIDTAGRVAVPSLPMQGHLPSMLRNPLGHTLTHSHTYRLWCQAGSVLGFFLPIASLLALLLRYKLPYSTMSAATLTLTARPLFFLSCQIITETLSQRSMAPLPIRILIPVVYNAIRLGPLWEWTTTSSSPTTPLIIRLLALLNLLYWSINLFAFLIPTATMKYMRAHFFCVEATEVQTTRNDQIGLL